MRSGAALPARLLLLCATACGSEGAKVPEAWTKVSGGAVMAFSTEGERLPAGMSLLLESFSTRFGVEFGSDTDIGWLLDPRAPTGYASLAQSPTFRAAYELHPPSASPKDGLWLFVDLQVLVDGLRARAVERFARMLPALDALGLTSLLFAVGDVRQPQGDGSGSFEIDLLVQSVDASNGPRALLRAGAVETSLLAAPAPTELGWLEMRFDPQVAARMLTATAPQLREGELRLDAVLFGYLAGAGAALMQQADGRLALRIGAERQLAFAFGVHDAEEARDLLVRRVPQFDRDTVELPSGESLRFEPGRIVIGRGEIASPSSFTPATPCSGVMTFGARRVEFSLAHEGATGLRVLLRID